MNYAFVISCQIAFPLFICILVAIWLTIPFFKIVHFSHEYRHIRRISLLLVDLCILDALVCTIFSYTSDDHFTMVLTMLAAMIGVIHHVFYADMTRTRMWQH